MKRPVLLDRKQLARYLQVSIRTIGRWRRVGKLPRPIIEDTKRSWWSREQIDLWMMGTPWASMGQNDAEQTD